MLPEGTVGHLLLHELDLVGRELAVATLPIRTPEGDGTAGGRLRIVGLRVEPRYAPATPLEQLDDPHSHALALVVETEVVEGDFTGIEQHGDANGELRHEGGRVRHGLRVDPLRELSGGRWRHCSILLAECDEAAASRVERALDEVGGPDVASRLARAAQPPMADDGLADWFVRSMPADLVGLPWAEGTRVERDGLRYEVELTQMQPESSGGFAVIHKALVSVIVRDVGRGEIEDLTQQELYFGGAIDWRWHAQPRPARLDAVVRRWAEHQMASLRRFFAEHPSPRGTMPNELPWACPLSWLLLEQVRHGDVEPRPRPVTPRRAPPSLEVFERDVPGVVGRFAVPDSAFTIECEVDNPWSYRLRLREGEHQACLLEARSDGMNGDIRVIERDAGRVREVARWLYDAALAAGNPVVTLPEEPPAHEEEDDEVPVERKPIGELLGFTPESELLDWRCIPDDITYADCDDEGTDVDDPSRALWRRFLDEHFDAS